MQIVVVNPPVGLHSDSVANQILCTDAMHSSTKAKDCQSTWQPVQDKTQRDSTDLCRTTDTQTTAAGIRRIWALANTLWYLISQELNQKSTQPTQKSQPPCPLQDYQLPPVTSRLPAPHLSRVNIYSQPGAHQHLHNWYLFLVLILHNTTTSSWRVELGKSSRSSPPP